MRLCDIEFVIAVAASTLLFLTSPLLLLRELILHCLVPPMATREEIDRGNGNAEKFKNAKAG